MLCQATGAMMTNASPTEANPQVIRDLSTPVHSEESVTSPASVRYPVLLEEVEGGWIASILGVSGYRAVGVTRVAAVKGLEKVMLERLEELLPLKQEVTQIELPFVQSENPLLRFLGHLREDPVFDEYMASIADYRQELDAELEAEQQEEAQAQVEQKPAREAAEAQAS